MSVSLYYWSESDIRVKSYCCLNLPCTLMFNFKHLDILCALIGHPSEKSSTFKFLETFCCLISSDSIYYWPELEIRAKSCGRLNLPYAFMFNFLHLDILCALIVNLSEKLWTFEFLECFHCSISSDSIYYWPESDIRVKSYGHLNFQCASMFNYEDLDILCTWIGHLSEKLCNMS